ncbi:MAG: sigma 54-interacting transcriptional regulator, partial [Acidobacteria bacterium]|nr:sigma 54-interacting transcriptional regulator [Acidobacteriota bacterium]
LFITGAERDRVRAEVELRKGRFRPFSAADAGELTRMTAALFGSTVKGKTSPRRRNRIGRVLSLLPDGIPEAMAMSLADLRAADFTRRAQALGAIHSDGRWRLPSPPRMRRDALHSEIAGLFPPGSGAHHRHLLLAGDDGGEALGWVRAQAESLESGEALSTFTEVEPESVPVEVRLALTEVALGELNLTEARRWLSGVSKKEAAPWTRWLHAIDTPPEVARELAPGDEEACAPRAAAEVALRLLEGAALGTEAGGSQAAAALQRCAARVGGLARRRLEMNLHVLTGNNSCRDREWRRAVTAGSVVLRRELAHRMALVMLVEGRHRASARLLRRVADEEPAPGRAGLIQLDLGRASLFEGDTAAADRHHLQAFRLLQAAGFRFRTRIVLFNMAVSDLDKLEVNRARARFSASDDGRPDDFLDWERTRLALAIGDERRFIEGVRRLPPQDVAEADGVGEATAFLRGVAALLRHDVAAAVDLLERGGQEGSTWLPLAKTLLGETSPGRGEGPDPWGLELCSRLASAVVRGDDARVVSLLEDAPPSLPSRALAVALCERIFGRQQAVGASVRARAASVLADAGLDGWARSLQGDGTAGAEVMTVLGRLLEEGSLGALGAGEVEELLGGLGVTGLEVRLAGNGNVVWRVGEGEESDATEGSDISLVALGSPTHNRALWRLLAATVSLLVDPGQKEPDSEAAASGFYGVSDPVRKLRAELERLAPASVPVTILGETGVGKEVAARALHRLSGRRGRFVGVNMAAVPAALVESELFGSVRGAYTGADRERSGLAVAAHHGTLFLDEIGDLDLALQAKLLRFLESHEVRPVGSDRAREVDVRIVAATHRDLTKLVETGAFRADLFYRIASVTVTIAPLRDRPDDIPVLRELFEGSLQRRSGRKPLRWSRDAEACLLRHHWPGNVRELRSVIEVAAVHAEGGIVRPEHLPFDTSVEPVSATSYEEALTQFRRRLFRSALGRHGGNRSAAARDLGISRQTLLYHIRTLGLTDV